MNFCLQSIFKTNAIHFHYFHITYSTKFFNSFFILLHSFNTLFSEKKFIMTKYESNKALEIITSIVFELFFLTTLINDAFSSLSLQLTYTFVIHGVKGEDFLFYWSTPNSNRNTNKWRKCKNWNTTSGCWTKIRKFST